MPLKPNRANHLKGNLMNFADLPANIPIVIKVNDTIYIEGCKRVIQDFLVFETSSRTFLYIPDRQHLIQCSPFRPDITIPTHTCIIQQLSFQYPQTSE
jgi:hypothetical protein